LAEVERTIEDRLREGYFVLLPEIRRVVEQLEAEVRYHVLPISRGLETYERMVVKSRIKECESALDALRRRQEGATFDRDRPGLYTLAHLNDLAGIRILVFPRSRLTEVDEALRNRKPFTSWNSDPVEDDGELTALTYYGYSKASEKVKGEYQIVSMLTGLFWEVEHSAMYKPAPTLKGVTRSLEMQQRYKEVLKALKAFEQEFEASVRLSQEKTR
jgi:ppGpp synthetase/RelA/SpoT-type nucleotidyltranferase